MTISRRGLLLGAAAGTMARGGEEAARLRARPRKAPGAAAKPGLYALGIRKRRDAQLYIPEAAAAAASNGAIPLLMYLHGATGSEQEGITRLREFAARRGFVLLSPGSTGPKWDAIRGGYGVDVRMLDEALGRAFEICQVDAKRVGVCGFSDGGSYALGIGLANGDLFGSLMAFSPGFVPAGFEPSIVRPRVFVSHGTNDQILPIDECSRRIVPELKRRGYSVKYQEFEGPHWVPREIYEEACGWFLNISGG